MNIVSRWLEERSKKKSVTEPRNQTTNVSSPLRGANQDYSGVGVKNDNADYTISDEHKHPNLNVPPHQPEWEIETKATRKAISKNLMKTTSKGVYGEETINELVSGVSNVRIKPVNMAQSTGGSGSTNAPSNTKSLQTASNIRVSQLDRAAQQQKDQSKKDQEKQIADREKAAAQRQKESQKQMKESNMKTFKDFSQLNEATRMDIIKTASKQAAIKAGVKVTPPKKPAKENPIKLREEALGDHANLAKYADEHGGIDKEALHTAAKHMKSGDMGALKKHIRDMDTDPRDVVLHHVARRHLQTLGYSMKGMKEDVEQIDEISTKTLVSYSQKAQKQVKGNQPSDPDKLRKRTNREQGIKLAYNKFYNFKAKVPATVSTNEEVELDENENKIASLQQKIKERQDALGLAREKRKMRGQRQQGPSEMKHQEKLYDLYDQLHALQNNNNMKESVDLDEANMMSIKVGEKVRLTNHRANPRHTVTKIKGQNVHTTNDSGEESVTPLSRVKSVKYQAQQLTKEEVEQVIEAKEDNPNTGNGRDPRQHIQVQAGRAMAGVPVDFKHDNGEISKLTAPMGRKIVSHLNGLKPADRQAAVSKMHASPAGLKV